MKANQKSIAGNDRAEVGVGTLIVFIAMVLVAAVAAAVLINTSGTLQQRAQQTGKEATQEVSSNLKVVGIYGTRNASNTNLWQIKINAEMSAGALPLDLQKLIVRYTDGSNARTYTYSGSYAATTASQTFGLTWIRGSGTNQVMKAGDLVEIAYNLYSGSLSTRTAVENLLVPETGTPVSADFQTPATFGTDTTVTLR